MAYRLDFAIALGASRAGLLDLRAQLVDTTGADVGAAVSTGFVDLGQGFYLWDYAAIPDGHRGAVKFYSDADPMVMLAVAPINPEEGENLNAKISTVGAVVGNGSESFRVQVRNASLQPVEGAAVWISTDNPATNYVAGPVYTDTLGYTPTLFADAGTYYAWAQKSGENITNPTTIAITDQ